MELAKRNAARQLLPYAELKAVEKKAQLESEFDWQTAYTKCIELVGGKAQVDIIIYDLVKGQLPLLNRRFRRGLRKQALRLTSFSL